MKDTKIFWDWNPNFSWSRTQQTIRYFYEDDMQRKSAQVSISLLTPNKDSLT